MIGGLSSIPSGGGKPEWGSPQNVHFVGSPVGGGTILPCQGKKKYIEYVI